MNRMIVPALRPVKTEETVSQRPEQQLLRSGDPASVKQLVYSVATALSASVSVRLKVQKTVS